MASEDEDLLSYRAEEARSPVQQRKLKRLKKASRAFTPQAPDDIQPVDEAIESSGLDNGIYSAVPRETLDPSDSLDRTLPASRSKVFDDGSRKEDGLEELFPYKLPEAPKGLDLEMESEFRTSDVKEHNESVNLNEATECLKVEKLAKKKQPSTRAKGKGSKKRSEGPEDEKTEESARKRKQFEKERKAHLDLLHADSQRLLRETRDVSFKPTTPVQRPISSVLEKIRLRKLEVSKSIDISEGPCDDGGSPRDTVTNFELPHAMKFAGGCSSENSKNFVDDGTSPGDATESFIGRMKDSDATKASPSEQNECLNFPTSSCVGDDHELNFPDPQPCHQESQPDEKALQDTSQNANQKLANDIQDLDESQQTDPEDNATECHGKGYQEDRFTPSALVMELKCNKAPSEDYSSDAEYDDKENIEPQPSTLVDAFMKGNHVKSFIDEEAEEEDDSDNDLMRFDENEEDEESHENEELDDLIVNGYEEMPIDGEKRDELHQKWLEQQDEAATENVLQRLKYGQKKKGLPLLQQEDDCDNEYSIDKAMFNSHSTNMVKKNSTKVKHMIAQMFTDKDDVFHSSEDEETEHRHVRQRILEQTEEQASLLSPAEDENSREVFIRIKKLNVASNTKKRARAASSSFDTLILEGISNSSSKSSFLGRTSSNSLPSSLKQGSGMVKSFIFARDDSNSRSSFSTSDQILSRDQKENQPVQTATAKSSMSQPKSTQHGSSKDGNTSAPSLFQILRQSSISSDYNLKKINGMEQSQVVRQFAAFASAKKVVKMESKR